MRAPGSSWAAACALTTLLGALPCEDARALPVAPHPHAVAQAKKPTPAPSAKPAPEAKPSAGNAGAKKPVAPSWKKPAKVKGGSGVSNKAAKKPGSLPAPPDPTLRAAIAGEEAQSSKAEDSPELDAIKEVDDVLFPDVKAVEARDSHGASGTSSVYSSGLPPTVSFGSEKPKTGTEETTDFAWLSKLQKPDLPFRWDPRLVRYLDYFKNTPKGRTMVAALMKRSGRYVDSIQKALRQNHLPEDIAWLALVESGMNPRIASHAGAAGLWQFMPKAGSAYGLRIDRYVDERLDPERSTQAAMRYLSDLHTRFGRWELALAAYNMGHGGLLTSIRKYNTNDYWELSQLESGVPYETALYVPKIVALAFVARNRSVFGCEGIDLDPAESFDVVTVAPGVSLASVAGATGSSEEAISALNPALMGKSVPPRSGAQPAAFTVRVPLGTGAAAESKLPKSSAQDLDHVTLRWGESLESVALEAGTTESKLRALNGLTSPVPPRPGTEIALPRHSPLAKTASREPVVAVVPAQSTSLPNRKHILYEVVWGDILDDVAGALGVTSDELCHWNNIDPSARLAGKMTLQAFVPADQKLDRVRFVEAKNAKLLTVGTPEFFDYFEAKNGRSRLLVSAKKGDTWAILAKRHGLSVGQLERINQRSHYAKLEEGDQVVVYTRRSDAPHDKLHGGAPHDEIDPERAPGESELSDLTPHADASDDGIYGEANDASPGGGAASILTPRFSPVVKDKHH